MQDVCTARKCGDGSPVKNMPGRCMHAGHGMLGEFAAETAGSAVLQHLAAKLPATDLSDSSAGQQIMTKAFKAAHEAALQLYREPPEHYTYPKGSRQALGPVDTVVCAPYAQHSTSGCTRKVGWLN